MRFLAGPVPSTEPRIIHPEAVSVGRATTNVCEKDRISDPALPLSFEALGGHRAGLMSSMVATMRGDAGRRAPVKHAAMGRGCDVRQAFTVLAAAGPIMAPAGLPSSAAPVTVFGRAGIPCGSPR